MSRRFTPLQNSTVHITIRCNNKEYLFNLDQTFNDIASWINVLPLFFKVHLHHVLLMDNHIHMIATPTKDNMGRAMGYLLTNLAKYLNFINNRRDHVFGDRYHPTVIEDQRHLLNAIRYLYQNPVRANMAKDIFSYRYSSLGFYVGDKKNEFIIHPDPYTTAVFSSGIDGYMYWHNRISKIMPKSDAQLISDSMKRKHFKFTRIQRENMGEMGTSLSI